MQLQIHATEDVCEKHMITGETHHEGFHVAYGAEDHLQLQAREALRDPWQMTALLAMLCALRF